MNLDQMRDSFATVIQHAKAEILTDMVEMERGAKQAGSLGMP